MTIASSDVPGGEVFSFSSRVLPNSPTGGRPARGLLGGLFDAI